MSSAASSLQLKPKSDVEIESHPHSPDQQQTPAAVKNLSWLHMALIGISATPFLITSILFVVDPEHDTAYYRCHAWIWLPISVAGAGLPVLLRPTDDSPSVKAFVISLIVLTTMVPAAIFLCYIDPEHSESQVLMWGIVALAPPSTVMLFKVRSYLRVLPEPLLETFLIRDLLIGSASGMTLILLLAFESLSCALESRNSFAISECTATIIAQFSLSFMVAALSGARVIARSVPSNIMERYNIDASHLATFDMGTRDKVRASLLGIALIASMHLLGNLGVRQSAHADNTALYIISCVGGAALVLTILWTMTGVYFDLRTPPPPTSLVEPQNSGRNIFVATTTEQLSSVYPLLSFILVCAHASCNIFYAVTMDGIPGELANMLLPVNVLLFILSMFAKPKSQDKTYLRLMTLHACTFIFVTFVSIIIGLLREGDNIAGFLSFIVMVVLFISYNKFGLHARDSIAKLQADDLSDFLINTLLRPVFRVLPPLLFLAFKPIRELLSNDLVVTDDIRKLIHAQMLLSAFLITVVSTRLVTESMLKSKKSNVTAWSIRKVATLQLTMTQKVEIVLFLPVAVISMWLLSIIFSGTSSQEPWVVWTIGVIGGLLLFIVFVLETSSALRNSSDKVDFVEDVSVLELSNSYVMTSFIVSLAYAGHVFTFSLTEDTTYSTRADLIWILSLALFAASIAAKPRRSDRPYHIFFYLHFFIQVIVPESCYLISYTFVTRETARGLLATVRLFLTSCIFFLGKSLRMSVADLEDNELSTYLTQTVLTGTVEGILPLMFLSLEALGCIAERGEEQCSVAIDVSTNLSAFIFGSSLFSMINKSAREEVQMEVRLSLKKLATFDLLPRQKLQLLLTIIVGLSAAYMIPFIGTRDASISGSVIVLGATGSVAFLLSIIIECLAFKNAESRHKSLRSKKSHDTSSMNKVSVSNPIKHNDLFSIADIQHEGENVL